MHPFGVGSVVERLRAAGGGYEVVHESAGAVVGEVEGIAGALADGGDAGAVHVPAERDR